MLQASLNISASQSDLFGSDGQNSARSSQGQGSGNNSSIDQLAQLFVGLLMAAAALSGQGQMAIPPAVILTVAQAWEGRKDKATAA